MLRAVRELLAPGFRWKLRRRLQHLLAQTQDCRRTQSATLQRLLRLNAGSGFQHDFHLRPDCTVEEFRRTLPVGNYDTIAAYVDLARAGRPEALLGPQNSLLMFAMTSGTTSSTKFIPITRQFLRDYRRGWQIWGIGAFDAHPPLHHRQIFQLTSSCDQFRTPAGTPCGNISGLVQQMQSRILRSMYVVPPSVNSIDVPLAKMVTALKYGLCARQLGMMLTANPSTLCQLFQMLDVHAETLIRDLAHGTDSITPSVGPKGTGHSIKNLSRARALDRILQSTGRLHPTSVWPQLQLVAVWTGGSAAAYLPALREYLGSVPIRDHGLHASEGRMTIPLEDETSCGVLDIGSHFFEFIPEEEIQSTAPTVLQAHELIEDESYYILLTTASGLYRYDIRDVVQCTGFLGTTPMLRFLHKGSHISNLTGEKLTESQVVGAVVTVAQKMQLQLDRFTIAPQWGEPPRYRLLLDESRLPSLHMQGDFAALVEMELAKVNLEYQEKRRSLRLDSLELLPVPSHLWREFIEGRQSQLGGSLEQYKHPCLIPKLEFLPQFLSRFLPHLPPQSELPLPTIR